MKFGVRARKGWKSKVGIAEYNEGGFKINVRPTSNTNRISNRQLFWDLLTVLLQYYDVEYLDLPRYTTVRAAGNPRTNRIAYGSANDLFELVFDNPELRVLKDRILAKSEKQKKRGVEQKALARLRRTYRQSEGCVDCSKEISSTALRCHKCSGKHTAKMYPNRRKGGRPKSK